MNFFFPWLLLGCLFSIIVILLHFISYSKKKQISYLSTFRFFNSTLSVQKKKINIKDILLMLVRILLIIAIVLFFSHPYKLIIKDKKLQKQVIVLIDDTASMHKKNNKKKIIEILQKKINEKGINKSLKKNQLGYIFSPSTNLNVRFVNRVDSLFSLINNRDQSHFTVNHSDALASAIFSFDQDKEKILIVISDFQKVNWVLNRSYKIDKNLNIEWVDIAENKENIFEDNILIEKVKILAKKNLIEVSIKNDSFQNKKGKVLWSDLQYDFFIESKRKTNIYLAYEKKKIINKITIDVNDEYLIDNEYYFSLQKNKELRVAMIGDFSLMDTQKNFSLLNKLIKTGSKNLSFNIETIDFKTFNENKKNNEDYQFYFFLNGSEKLSKNFFLSLGENSKDKLFFLFPYLNWQLLFKKFSDASILKIQVLQQKRGNYKLTSFNEQSYLTKVFINEEGDIYQFAINNYFDLKLPQNSIRLLSIEEDPFFSVYNFSQKNKIYISSSSLNSEDGDFSFSYTFIILMKRIIEEYMKKQNPIVKKDSEVVLFKNFFSFHQPGIYKVKKKIYQVNSSRDESSSQKILMNELSRKIIQKKNSYKKKLIKNDQEFKSYRFAIFFIILLLLLLEFLLSDIWMKRVRK